MVGGMVRIPMDISSFVTGKQPMGEYKNSKLHGWAVKRFSNAFSRKAKQVTWVSSEDEIGTDVPIEEYPERVNSYYHGCTAGNIPVIGSEYTDNDIGIIHQSPNREQQLMTARTKGVFTDTPHYTGRIATQLLDFFLRLPTDFALGLTKGFHNAPKLYNDSTVKEFPIVRSTKSGIRAATTVILHIQGISGSHHLLTS
jgi:hypothetical protein